MFSTTQWSRCITDTFWELIYTKHHKQLQNTHTHKRKSIEQCDIPSSKIQGKQIIARANKDADRLSKRCPACWQLFDGMLLGVPLASAPMQDTCTEWHLPSSRSSIMLTCLRDSTVSQSISKNAIFNPIANSFFWNGLLSGFWGFEDESEILTLTMAVVASSIAHGLICARFRGTNV